MVKNSDKTYGHLIQEAKNKTDRQEVGETVSELAKYFKNLVEEICNQQAEQCLKKNFHLEKYYIWVGLRKSSLTPNELHVMPIARVSRPLKDHTVFKDHILWSVTGMNIIKFEWNVIAPELANYILKNKPNFHDQTVRNVMNQNKIEDIKSYMHDGKII